MGKGLLMATFGVTPDIQEMEPITALITEWARFAMSGTQEFVIAMSPLGLCVWIFGRKIQDAPVKKVMATGKRRATAKRKKRTARNPRTVQTRPKPEQPKPKPKPKPWYVAPPFTPEQDILWHKYQMGNIIKK